MKENVIDKVRKLLALSESSNEHEAKAAMLKARELMAQHKISTIDVQEKEDKQVSETTTAEKTRKKWRYQLADVLAKNFRCKIYFRGNGSDGHKIVFVGFEEDAKLVHLLYSSAVNVIEKNQNRLYREYRKIGKQTKGIKDSYAIGFIGGLDEAFEKQKETYEQEWGLVLQTPVEVKNHMSMKKFDGKGIKTNSKISNGNALSRGYADGKNHSLHDQLEV